MRTNYHHSEETRKKISEFMKRLVKDPLWRAKHKFIHEGKEHHSYIDGRYPNPKYVSWVKNERNRKVRGATDNHTFEEWMDVLEKSGGKCAICKKTKKLAQDHIVPLCLGGSNKISNIQAVCKSCNSRKGIRLQIKKETG